MLKRIWPAWKKQIERDGGRSATNCTQTSQIVPQEYKSSVSKHLTAFVKLELYRVSCTCAKLDIDVLGEHAKIYSSIFCRASSSRLSKDSFSDW